MKNKIKRIGIDARLYGPVGRGLGRYIQEVVDGILATDKENEYVVFLSPDNYESFVLPSSRVKKYLVKARWYSLAEQFIWPGLIRRQRLDLIHFPHFNVPFFCPTKFIVTIHDLILYKYPSRRASTRSFLMYWLKYLFYKIIIKSAVKNSEAILTVSQFTKKDILKHFTVNKEKIIVTHEGVSKRLKKDKNKDDKKIVLGYNISIPYLLYVGNAYPHKNLITLIDVFASLRQKYKDLSLVLVGKHDYFYQQLIKIIKQKKIKGVFLPGFIPDQDLVSFYSQALIYVFPSKYEGFGLPPLEAMANACPVVSSNRASLPEILGSAVLYFDPNDKKDMFKQIERLMIDSELRQTKKQSGFRKILEYGWDDSVNQTLSLYGKVLFAGD